MIAQSTGKPEEIPSSKRQAADFSKNHGFRRQFDLFHDNVAPIGQQRPVHFVGRRGSSPTFTGSIIANTFSSSGNGWRIRYDESLNNVSTSVGTGWSMLKWYDLQGTAESRTLASATGNFLN